MRIFKSHLIVLFVITMVSYSSAQMTIGVKTGINVADATVAGPIGDLLPDIRTNSGFTVGVWSEINMLNGFSFRPELNYTQKGFRFIGDLSALGINTGISAGIGARVRLNTMEAPLLVKYSIGNDVAKVYAILGPTVSYSTDAIARPIVRAIIDFNIPGQEFNLSNDIFRRWELSGTVGIGGEIKAGNGKIFGDVRYNHAISTMLNNPIVDLDLRNKSFGVHVGYGYTF